MICWAAPRPEPITMLAGTAGFRPRQKSPSLHAADPRAGQALVLGAKAAALLDGRAVPAPEDVTRVALPVLRHRLLVNFQAEADGITPDDVIRRLLDAVRP